MPGCVNRPEVVAWPGGFYGIYLAILFQHAEAHQKLLMKLKSADEFIHQPNIPCQACSQGYLFTFLLQHLVPVRAHRSRRHPDACLTIGIGVQFMTRTKHMMANFELWSSTFLEYVTAYGDVYHTLTGMYSL